eukprot:6324026-Alexandrium_andersonii.AAC.1
MAGGCCCWGSSRPRTPPPPSRRPRLPRRQSSHPPLRVACPTAFASPRMSWPMWIPMQEEPPDPARHLCLYLGSACVSVPVR